MASAKSDNSQSPIMEEDEPAEIVLEDDSRRPSIVYEEDMSVILRRRGVKMTVRIFGAEDDNIDPPVPAPSTGAVRKQFSRSASCTNAGEKSPTKKHHGTAKKKRSCKSVSSLDDVSLVKTNLKRQYFQKLKQSISNSLSPEQSGDDTSPMMSPCSTLSPTTPDSMALLRPESPTKGLGQFHKGRSSSIATTESQHIFRMRGKPSSRRFSVDSVPRRILFRLFSREMRKVAMCKTLHI